MGHFNAAERELASVKTKSSPSENEIMWAQRDLQKRQAELNLYFEISALPLAP